VKIWIRPHPSGSRYVRFWQIVQDGNVIELAKSRNEARIRRRELLTLHGQEIKDGAIADALAD